MSRKQARSAKVHVLASATLVAFMAAGFSGAQTTPAPASTPPGAAAPPPAQGAKSFSQEQLDQILAPIALYPDGLLAQVLMASTYPIEIVTAERWVKANPGLKDKALEDALQKQPWDASVKSMAAFPQVLTMMSEKLDWTQKLGDAFLAQKEDVAATIQNLRQKASKEGQLKDTKEQKVVTQQVESKTVIVIEPANPQVVYVPTYNPAVVYGTWWYPSYPPYYYYPPGYAVAGAAWGFAAGVAAGAIWGNYNWGGGDVNIDIDRYNNFNKTNIQNNVQNKNWNHDASHRGAVPYKDQGVAQKYNRGASPTASTRDASRGRDGGAGSMDRASAGTMDRGSGGASAAQRGGAGGVSASPRDSYGGGGASASSRDMSGTRNSSAFNTGSGAQTRNASSRGNTSMSSSRASSGASRGGGGGGGGGGRGGGGRR